MKKMIYRILMLVCIGICLFSGWKLYEIWNEGHTIKKESETLNQFTSTAPVSKDEEEEDVQAGFEVDWASLKAKNAGIVGWIIIPGADINFAVAQGSDNSYYLDHTILGEYNRQGAIFLDCAVQSDLSDDNTIVYGHSVDIGGMFTNLDKFEDRTFFDEHPYFWYLTEGQNYKCNIIAFCKTDSSSAAYTYDFGDYREAVLSSVLSSAAYTRDVPLDDEDHFMTLSTCDLDYGYHSNQRLILFAQLEKYDKPIVLDEAAD